MKIEEIKEVIGGTWLGKIKKEKITGISIDTRTIEKGNVFFAIPGKKIDGHHYIDEAIEKGASMIVVQKEVVKKKVPILKVENTIEALQQLASYQRQKYPVPLIAITGSVGKTTLKELVSHILSPTYRVLKNEGNQNNHLGLPLTLLKLNANYDVIVTEMGMNHKGELHHLSMLAKPDFAMITNIGTSHIGNLKSKRNIYAAKREILDGMNQSILVVNGDDPYLKKEKRKNSKVILCGKKRRNQMRILNTEITRKGTNFLLEIGKKKYLIQFPLPGEHYPTLVSMAIAIALELGVPLEEIIARITKFQGMEHRLEVKELSSNITLVDDAYNASLESYQNAFDFMKKDQRRKLFIIGDILELGTHQKRIYRVLARELNHIKHSEVWLCGDAMKELQKEIHMGTYFETKQDMINAILENDWSDAIILVKASHALGFIEVADAISTKYAKKRDFT